MKKITAFFMALLPIFVMLLLFVTGIIVKKVDPSVHADKIEITEPQYSLKKPDEKEPTHQLVANVLPKIANQAAYWKSADTNIVEVNDEGLITGKAYGDAYVYATSQDNPTLVASCKVHVYDDKIHQINVDNEYQIAYTGITERKQIQISTVPSSEDIINPNLNYKSSNEDILGVTPTGLLVPKQQSTGNVTITIQTQTEPVIVKEVQVKVGPGVTQVGLTNSGETSIIEKTYNLWNDIDVSPEKKENLSATDFTYTSEDENVATIDENGVATFKTPTNAAVYPTTTFHATYKRNTDLTISKKVTCTNNNFQEINFNTDNLTWEFSGTAGETITTLSAYSFPQTDNLPKTAFASSNPDVVSIDYVDNKPVFKANKAGYALLSATVSTGDKENPTKTDVCSVNVVPKDAQGLVKEETVTLSDSNYYSLRKNLNMNLAYCGQQEITWTKTDDEEDEIATLDDENEVLHFKKAGQVTIKGEISSLFPSPVEFKVNCTNTTVTQCKVDDSTKTILVPAGQITRLQSTQNWQPSFDDSQKENFDLTKDESGVVTFIPKSGCDYPIVKLVSGELTKEVRFIVKEDPVALLGDLSPVTTIDNTKWWPYDFASKANIRVLPSTATNNEGKLYSSLITYNYECADTTASIEENTITFKSYGLVLAQVKCGDFTPYNYVIKSTYGEFGRFDVLDADENKVNPYQQFKNVTTSTPLILTTDSITESEASNVKIESMNNLCDTSLEWSSVLLLDGKLTYTITPKKGAYGDDIIHIYTNTYSFFIRVNVDASIQDFNLYCNDEILSTSLTSKTYTKNLDIYIDIVPFVAKGQTYTVKFNGNDVTVKDNWINLSDATWNENNDNELVISTSGSEAITKTYKFTHSSNKPDFVLKNQDKTSIYDKGFYLTAKAASKIVNIVPDGLVDKTFYTEDLKYDFKAKGTETLKISNGILMISNVPMTVVGDEEYTNTITLTVGDISKTYEIGRDKISKVVLPKHDNRDQTDLKGLQKVHVYGNSSFYSAAEGEVKYYKLPIELYDYKNNVIEDTETTPEAKKKAYENEIKAVSLHGSTLTYHSPDANNTKGFVEVAFSDSCLYTPEEIYNNEFVNGTKGETVQFSNRSADSIATYSFVTVQGINVYCQEALRGINDSKLSCRIAVLQTNFGLKDVTTDNVPLDDANINTIPGIYGNGYTINFDEFVKQRKAAGSKMEVITATYVTNATVQGCEHSSLDREFNYNLHPCGETIVKDKVLFRYSILRGFTTGSNVCGNINGDVYFRDTLFYDRVSGSIWSEQDNGHKVFIENCIFFDSGAFAIALTNDQQFYFKGFIDVYNFHNKEMLIMPGGLDFSSFWPIVEKIAKGSNMIQLGADGKNYINSFMCSALNSGCYFWSNNKGEYVKGTKGQLGGGEFLDKYVDLDLGSLKASLWGTHDPAHEKGAPSYYDEYDQDGRQRVDFLANQIKKIMRPVA